MFLDLWAQSQLRCAEVPQLLARLFGPAAPPWRGHFSAWHHKPPAPSLCSVAPGGRDHQPAAQRGQGLMVAAQDLEPLPEQAVDHTAGLGPGAQQERAPAQIAIVQRTEHRLRAGSREGCPPATATREATVTW